MTSFIVIGDPHFQVTNIPEVNMFIARLLDLIVEKDPDYIICLGDLLHTHERLHTTALNKAYEFIDKIRAIKPVYVLVGNHDMTNNQQFLTQNHWMNGMKEWDNVTIVDTVVPLEVDDKLFLFCPYVPNGRFVEALDTYEGDWTDASCIFAHQEFHGCKMGAITSIDGDKWKESYPHVISGHIHSKQKIQENVYYTGSAMQHAFGESTKNIIAYVEFDNDTDYSLDEVDLNLPRKRIVYKEVEDMEEYEPPAESKDKIKVTITGNYEQFKAFKKTKKYKNLIKKGAKIVFKPKKLKTDKKSLPEMEQESDFRVILAKLVNHEKDVYLFQVHENVVNGKNISEDDVMFL
jgi:DNA repair exonuclease SbcCD nuclease subunit